MSSIDAATGGGYTPDPAQAKSRAATSPAANPANPAALPGRGRALPEKPEERFVKASNGKHIMPSALNSVQRHGDGTVTVGTSRMSATEYERVSAAVLANLRDYQNEYRNWKAQCLLNR